MTIHLHCIPVDPQQNIIHLNPLQQRSLEAHNTIQQQNQNDFIQSIKYKEQDQQMVRATSAFNTFLLKFDIFSSTEFFRVRQKQFYRTKTGAICTIFVLVLLIVLFVLRINSRIRGDLITYKSKSTFDSSQLVLKASTQGKEKFMFAIHIQDENLTSYDLSYFDIFSRTQKYNSSTTFKYSFKNFLYLQPCRIDHWSNTNPEIQAYMNRINISSLFCPPIGTQFNITGKNIDSIRQYGYLVVRECTQYGNSYFNKTCIEDQKVQEKMMNTSFSATFIFLNSFLNPDQIDPVTYYLDDDNYLNFTLKTLGSRLDIAFSKFQISTNRNLIPIASTADKFRGAIVQSKGIVSSQPTTYANLKPLSISLKRSSINTFIDRNDHSIIDLLAYIGGLATTLIALFGIILSSYSQYIFEIKISNALYTIPSQQKNHDEKNVQNSQKDPQKPVQDPQKPKQDDKITANFFTFLKDKICCCFEQSKRTRLRQQINNQLDIKLLIQKMNSIESFVCQISSNNKIDFQELARKKSLNQMAKIRRTLTLVDQNGGEKKTKSSPTKKQKEIPDNPSKIGNEGPLEINLGSMSNEIAEKPENNDRQKRKKHKSFNNQQHPKGQQQLDYYPKAKAQTQLQTILNFHKKINQKTFPKRKQKDLAQENNNGIHSKSSLNENLEI